MNDDAKRARMRAGVIGAAVGVAAIGAIVVVATNKDNDDEERVPYALSKRDTQFPRVDPGVVAVAPDTGPKWQHEPRAVPTNRADDLRQRALEQARIGILGSTGLTQGGAFASLTGTGSISSGFDDKNIYGGLLGNEAGEMNGGFGYGRSGFGPGGGGTGWGTIGTGRYGTISGGGYGAGGGRPPRSGPVATLGPPSVTGTGELDKAIVRRYLRRNLAKLTYCYEKELLAKPALAGTVSSTFSILESGKVQNVSTTGVDAAVGSCVSSVLNSIEFPKPKGSGGVQVSVTLAVRPK
jgi:hypothetical protein